MTLPISSLKNKYPDKTVWIIGKGPSLQYLKKSDIGDGPVITLNQSIIKVNELKLDNDIYSMQKDNGQLEPFGYPLLVHLHEESNNYLPDYNPRYLFDNKEFGLRPHHFSALTAIKIGEMMGCNEFIFVCFDACTTGDLGDYIPGDKVIYDDASPMLKVQCQEMLPFLKNINYKFITPT